MVYETRGIKLATIKRIVEECDQYSFPALKEKLIAYCGKEWGTARQTAQAMLKELEAQDEIVVNGEEVWLYLRWQKILTAREQDYLKMEDIMNGNKTLH
jgi:hypothetical protein